MTSLGEGQLPSTIRDDTLGGGSYIGEGEEEGGGEGGGGVPLSPINKKVEDVGGMPHPSPPAPIDAAAATAAVQEAAAQLKETRRPFLRLWSTGTELVAIALIVAGNALIASEEFSRLDFY
mmetsp:Transcript_13599/g.18834  ORF Transcript_13599/g.18834 Transcript_13599/m.18834 type:complete len:121 (+) Transcript_13599:3-365(+)